MRVNKWGHNGWDFLHTITFNYPIKPTIKDKENYKTLFLSLNNTLPCIYCQESFIIYSKYIPIDYYLEDRNGLSYWLYIIHNLVNYKLGKENVNFIDVIKKYESYRAKCGKMTNENKNNVLTCQIKAETLDLDFINKINDDTLLKYENITIKYLIDLYKSKNIVKCD